MLFNGGFPYSRCWLLALIFDPMNELVSTVKQADFTMIKILIVDDHPYFRKRLKAFLVDQPGLEVVGEASDGLAALSAAKALKPDIVLLDIKMGGMNGLSVARHLKTMLPEVHVIFLSQYDLDAYREAAQEAGASAYLAKKDLVENLLPTIQRVAQAH